MVTQFTWQLVSNAKSGQKEQLMTCHEQSA